MIAQVRAVKPFCFAKGIRMLQKQAQVVKIGFRAGDVFQERPIQTC
jgi:hypothetical protein